MAANGIELASAYVTVLVKAPGIGKSLNQAVNGVDLSAAGKRIGNQISESVGKSIKSQVAKQFADATAAALEKQTAATKKLSDAEHALVKARAQHGTTNAKVSAAEEKLDQLRKSGKASAADLEKAEAALQKAQTDHVGTGRAVASAQNAVAEAKRNATEASKAYSDALDKEQSKSERAQAWMVLASDRAGEISQKWTDAGTKITGIGESLTSKITKPVALAGGAVATLVGALGFKRLIGIDTARGQFQGLGMDADAVMQQVDRGVTNTSLSMAQGASLAVGILATGAVPLEGLEAQIKRVSNVSAAYNVDAEHAAYLLNNVLTKNKVTWGDLSQMQQNQIPIVTQLADYYGVAGDEIMKMAQEGAISVSDLNTVLDLNAGAAAEAYAGTWQGVTSNILANLGRIGAKFLEPTFNIMKDEAAGFLDMLKSDEFATVATDIGNRIAEFVTSAVAGLRDLIGWWSRLSPGMQQAIAIAAGVAVAAGPVLIVVGKIATGVGALFNVIKIGIPIVRAFGIALAANPIGAIITAIGLLVAGLVWFFTKTELGQKIWGEFTRFLGEAWQNVSSFFVTVYETYIKPVFDGIATVAKWLFENILLPQFKLAQVAFAILGGIFQGIWDFILKPVFEAIGAIFRWLYENVIVPIVDGVKLQIEAWAAIFSWLWTTILKPTFDAIGAVFRWLYDTIISPVIDWVKEKLQIWGLAMQLVWSTYIQPALDAVGAAFNWIYQNIIAPVVAWIQEKLAYAGIAFRMMQDVVRQVWEAVAAKIQAGWNTVKGIIDTLVRVISSDPKKAFEAARDAIGTAWSAIQDLAKKPVRFVVETVIGGLIDTINKIPGVNIAKPVLPKGFSDGGFTGNMPANAVAGLVHGNEHVIRAASRMRIERSHPGVLDHMNRYGEIPGYKKGGLVHPLPGAAVTTAFMGYPGHTGIDLAKPAGTPVQAAGAGIVTHAGWAGLGGNMVYLDHGGGLSTRYAHMLANIPVSVGALVKAGQTIGYEGSTGNSTGPHLHYEVLTGGKFVDPAPYLAGGGNPLFGILDGLLDWATSTFKQAFPGSDMWVDTAGGLMKQGVSAAIEWATDLLSIGGTTPTLYDRGGWLPEGLSLVENRSGRPEPILTGSQWDEFLGGRAGTPMEVRIEGDTIVVPEETDPVIFGKRQAEATRKALSGLAK